MVDSQTLVAQGHVQLRGVAKIYGRGDLQVDALSPTDFEVRPGDFVSIVGPSGCGKTTLLKIIGDIIPPTEGEVLIDGDSSEGARRKREIGYVFQTPVLLPWRTVKQNAFLPFHVSKTAGRGAAKRNAEEKVNSALDIVGLGEFVDRLPRELSGGMQARVALARALVHEPKVLLMDEPFASLDELTRTEMASHLLDVWERVRTTVVFVTHHIEEAVLLSNQVLVMSDRPGRLLRKQEVDLPRPRSLDTRRSPRFREIVEDLVAEFHSGTIRKSTVASNHQEAEMS